MILQLINKIMPTTAFIKIIYLLLIVADVTANLQTFPQFVETGSVGFFGFPGMACVYGTTTLSITFTTNKGTPAYNPTFSMESLRLAEDHKQLSVRLFLSGQSDSSLAVSVDTQCKIRLFQIYVRYLVVVPPLVGPVNLVYFTQDYAAGVVLNHTTHKVTLSQSIPLVANQTRSALFLMGFNIKNSNPSQSFIDLYCQEFITNTGVTVDITSIDSTYSIILYQISLTVVTVSTSFIFNSHVGTFPVVTLLNNYGGGSSISSPVSSSPIYSNSTTFLGIRSFKNNYNSLGLYFYFTITPINIFFQTSPLQSPLNSFSISFINFAFPLSCNATAPYLLSLNNTCHASCPASFFASSGSFTCNNCSTSCLACSLSASNCTSCPDKLYLSNNTCQACPNQCLLCTSPTDCTSCIANYTIFNASCVVDCSSISQCSLCTLTNSHAYCTNCSLNYVAIGGGCVGKCGDGVVVAGEVCDDGNLQDNDGCSSSCNQEAYFVCTSATAGAISICSLNGMSLEYDYTIKVKTGNFFTSYFKVTPNIPIMQTLNWINGVSLANQSIAVVSCNYDASTGKLSITSAYTTDITSSVEYSFNYTMMSNLLPSIPASTNRQQLVAQNNLALQYYPDSAYQLATFIQYFSILLSVFAWIMLLAGYFCGKLVVLQYIAVVQVAYLCLLTVHQASPAFQALLWLRWAAGKTTLSENDYSAAVSRQLKGAYFSMNILESYNIALVLVILPILVAAILKILTKTACKSNPIIEKVWPIFLANITFYGLVFTAYTIFSQLCFSLLYIGSGVSTVYMGLAITSCQSFLLAIYCYYLNKMPELFGDFKKKFQRYNICSYYYTSVVVERFLTAILVMLLRDTSFGLTVAALPLLAQLIFVTVRNPYVCGGNRRPIINLALTILIMVAVLVSNLIPSLKNVQLCIPMIICVILTLVSALSLYYLIYEFKQAYFSEQAQKVKGSNEVTAESGAILSKFFKLQDQQTVQFKNRAQFEMFKQKIINGGDQTAFDFDPKTLQAQEDIMQKEMMNYQWDNYPIVTNNIPILHQMKKKVASKRIQQVSEHSY